MMALKLRDRVRIVESPYYCIPTGSVGRIREVRHEVHCVRGIVTRSRSYRVRVRDDIRWFNDTEIQRA